MECDHEMKPYKPRLTRPPGCGNIVNEIKSTLLPTFIEDNKRAYEKIKYKLPSNYVSKPGTIILIDKNDNPVLHDNGDGTVSGIEVNKFFEGNNLAKADHSPTKASDQKPWPEFNPKPVISYIL